MARPFETKYTQSQKHAMVAAVVDGGIVARQAVELAGAGKLPDPERPGELLKPFDCPAATAYHWAKLERNARAGKAIPKPVADPAKALDELVARLLGLADHELSRLEATARGRKPIDADRARKLAIFLRETKALAAGVHPTRGPGRKSDRDKVPSSKPTEPSEAAQQLLEAHKRSARGQAGKVPNRTNPDPDTDNGEQGRSEEPARTDAEQSEEQGSRVLTSASEAKPIPSFMASQSQ